MYTIIIRASQIIFCKFLSLNTQCIFTSLMSLSCLRVGHSEAGDNGASLNTQKTVCLIRGVVHQTFALLLILLKSLCGLMLQLFHLY